MVGVVVKVRYRVGVGSVWSCFKYIGMNSNNKLIIWDVCCCGRR